MRIYAFIFSEYAKKIKYSIPNAIRILVDEFIENVLHNLKRVSLKN